MKKWRTFKWNKNIPAEEIKKSKLGAQVPVIMHRERCFWRVIHKAFMLSEKPARTEGKTISPHRARACKPVLQANNSEFVFKLAGRRNDGGGGPLFWLLNEGSTWARTGRCIIYTLLRLSLAALSCLSGGCPLTVIWLDSLWKYSPLFP